MSHYTLYKCHKKEVCPFFEIPDKVKKFFNDHEQYYFDCEDTLKNFLDDEDQKDELKEVTDFFNEHDLWGYDLDSEYN